MKAVIMAIILACSLGAKCQQKEIETLSGILGAEQTFNAITLLKNGNTFFAQLNTLNYDSTISNYHTPEKEKLPGLLNQFQQDFDNMAPDTRTKIYKKILFIGCVSSSIRNLNKAINGEKEDPTLESLYYCDRTRFLFRKYMVNAKQQDWNSLSISESNKIFMEFLNYLSIQKEAKQKTILNSFFKVLITRRLE